MRAVSGIDQFLLHAVQELAGTVPVRLGTHSSEDAGQATLLHPTLWVNNRKALLALLLNPQMNFGDLYSQGQIEIEGDLVRLLESLYEAAPKSAAARVLSYWLDRIQANSLRGSRRNIHHHYDIPTDFYQLWLDRDLLYTCAYFPDESATLEQAQQAKMELVCRKLWLRPDETVVEAGCGWGVFALYMARHYGVRVKAFNVSHEQIAYARERARQEGLASRVEFVEDDYRNISGRFDAFVSVGMLEHVGRQNYGALGRVIRRAIGDSGRGLLHFIGRNRPQPMSIWIRRRIFPGAYPPGFREVAEIMEHQDYSVLDVENLRVHYAQTLECWLSRYEQSFDKVADRFGPVFARMWRLYLAGSIAAFRTGTLQLFQLVFAGSKCRTQPWTRSHLYDESGRQSGQDKQWIHATS